VGLIDRQNDLGFLEEECTVAVKEAAAVGLIDRQNDLGFLEEECTVAVQEPVQYDVHLGELEVEDHEADEAYGKADEAQVVVLEKLVHEMHAEVCREQDCLDCEQPPEETQDYEFLVHVRHGMEVGIGCGLEVGIAGVVVGTGCGLVDHTLDVPYKDQVKHSVHSC